MRLPSSGSWFTEAVARLQDEDPSFPHIAPHGLRHTSASIMLAGGVPLIVVSRQLGHANPNITATIYAHLLGDSQLDEAAAVFEPEAAPSGARRKRARSTRADGAAGA